MRFSHSKVSIVVSLLAILMISSTFLLSGVFFDHTPTRASSATKPGITKGTITVVPILDPAALSAKPSPRASRSLHPKGKSNANLIQAGALPFDQGQTGTILHNFNGVGSRDSANTNFGAEFEPPDQGLCVGNGFVLEAVNSAYTIYRPDGSAVTGPFNVNALFHEGLKQFTSDPRCYFDKSTHTWFAIILFINATNTRARTDLAVNPSGDPTTPWTVYHIDATDDGTNGTPNHSSCPCFGDQPLLGIDQQNVYISTNEFSILGPQANGAQIYAISKSELVTLSDAVHIVHFDNLFIGGSAAMSIQPAITSGPANAEYFLNSLDPTGTGDNRLGVWALTQQDTVTKGDTPNLSSVVLTSEPYGIPPGAQQKGTPSLLDAGDDRMFQVEFINGDLWGALDTIVSIVDDTVPRAGAAWFRIRPSLNGDTIGGAAISNQGYVASSGNYLLYPSIEVTPSGTAAMVLTLSGSNFFPSVVYTILPAGKTTFGKLHLAAHGTGPYDTTATRWGDYSAATLDPDQHGIWMATEYIPPLKSQTVDKKSNWGTRVLEISA